MRRLENEILMKSVLGLGNILLGIVGMRILLIEDSARLQRSISKGLKKEGFKVDVTGDGNDGLWYVESFDYDVIVLDLMLPGLDGMSILRAMRQKERRASVLILSAKDTVDDRVEGLEAGADDYLVKPFAFEELLARIRALIRRRYGVKQNAISLLASSRSISNSGSSGGERRLWRYRRGSTPFSNYSRYGGDRLSAARKSKSTSTTNTRI